MKYLARVCTGALTLGLLITSGSVVASAHRIHNGYNNYHYRPRTEFSYRKPIRRTHSYYLGSNQRRLLRRHHINRYYRIHHYYIHKHVTRTSVIKPKRIHHTHYKNYNKNQSNFVNIKDDITTSSPAKSNYNKINKANFYATKFTHSRISKLAKTKLGDPYKWGANGNNAFDCSGFTQYLYRRAKHIYLPRTAQAQYNYEKHVSYKHIKPGNLVFFGTSPQAIGHVGMYIGNGKMIDAQLRGVVVEDVQAPWWNLVGCAKVHRNYNY